MDPKADQPDPGNSGQPKKTPLDLLEKLKKFLTTGIWQHRRGESDTHSERLLGLLRILAISGRGLMQNRLFSRAAALSYSSLIALGPLVAIVVLLSSSFIQTDAETQIKRALLFISPSLQEMITIEGESSGPESGEEMSTTLDSLINQIVQGTEQLIGQINTGGSKAFGALGSLILIWVVIQLLTSVENTLNQIWGVHKGRPWSQRVVFYWTFISLGALLGLGSTALFSASNLAGMFDWFPFGGEMARLVLSLSPGISFIMLVLLLALFYRFFPNTSVGFKPALIGSILTAILLILNNYVSILYVHRVISFQSLYGSLGIIPVLMLGLYFFWVFILLGGQLTYAVQNVDFLASQAAWKQISPLNRELVTLAAFLHVGRRFMACQRAPTVSEISAHMKVPVNILNESMEILEKLDWVTRINEENKGLEQEAVGFRPSKPLASYNLSRFKSSMDRFGQEESLEGIVQLDPLLHSYRKTLSRLEQEDLFQRDLESLLKSDSLPEDKEKC